ncbi:hypothetical protein DMN40_11145 [Clostridium perfringens]|uniref:hypothetical protein n=1 Tax=Clostridium perfringens TaxID=1502 RepID=UPI0024BD2B26|nr:hypothetical protein [Clostridium perfringens]
MSKIINNLLRKFKVNIGLKLATITSIILMLFKEPILYFFQYYNIGFIKNIQPIVESVALGIISSYVFYFFTVSIPEKKKSEKIRRQILYNINDLKKIFYEYKNHLDDLKKFEVKKQEEIREHLILLNSKENLIDIYLNNINLLNNLYINNEDLNVYLNLYNEAKFKQGTYRDNLVAIIAYYKSMTYKIEDIIKSCDKDILLD